MSDLADGHVAALLKVGNQAGLHCYNLGGTAPVFANVTAFEKAVGKAIPYVIEPRRIWGYCGILVNTRKSTMN